MKILFLSKDEELAKFLEEDSNTLVKTIEKIDEEFVLKNKIDFIVSYGYRYILPYEVLRHFPEEQLIYIFRCCHTIEEQTLISGLL